MSAAGAVLFPYGRILIQAAHPAAMLGDVPEYRDGWRSMEEVAPGVDLPFMHRPLSRYIPVMGQVGLLLEDMDEPAPPPGF